MKTDKELHELLDEYLTNCKNKKWGKAKSSLDVFYNALYERVSSK